MTDIAETSPRKARAPYVMWAVTAYCFVAAIAMAVCAHLGRLPGHDLEQIAPVLLHLLVCGISFGIFLLPMRSRSPVPGGLKLATFLLALALSIVGLVLGANSAFNLTAINAPALALAIPGTIIATILLRGFLQYLLRLSSRSEDNAPGPEILEERPDPTLSDLIAFGTWGMLLLALIFALFRLAPFWFAALKMVLWTGAHYGIEDFARAIVAASGRFPLPTLVFILLFFIASSAWTILKQRFRKALSQDQRDVVQSRLRALWDYANSPSQVSRSWRTTLPSVLACFAIAACAVVVLVNGDRVIQWLASPSLYFAGTGWHYLIRNYRAEMIAPFVFVFSLAVSAQRLCIDCWPRALQAELVSNLRRSSLKQDSIDTYRRALERDVLRRGNDGFDARRFLLQRRMRTSWAFHLVSLALLFIAVGTVWRAVNSYTIATDSGFEVAPFFSVQKFHYRYGDVRRVEIECNRTSYNVEFNDGNSAELWLDTPVPESVAFIDRIDQRLRAARPRFVLFVDKRGIQGVRKCVQSLTREYGHADAFARIMHLH